VPLHITVLFPWEGCATFSHILVDPCVDHLLDRAMYSHYTTDPRSFLVALPTVCLRIETRKTNTTLPTRLQQTLQHGAPLQAEGRRRQHRRDVRRSKMR
jgi:hypothetical protein